MNNIENNSPCVCFALLVEEAKVNRVEHDGECFEEDQDQHQIVEFEHLKIVLVKQNQLTGAVTTEVQWAVHLFVLINHLRNSDFLSKKLQRMMRLTHGQYDEQ